MLQRILQLAVTHRHLVVVVTLVLSLIGARSLSQLPIDAVPDITNKQVQINVVHPALSVEDMERLVTFPLETALTGISGLDQTRSISRNGFCQVTAVFEDSVDIYFARQQVSERLDRAREDLPRDIEPAMGPITTGLGEVLMWTVEFTPTDANATAGKPGGQPDGTYLTPAGEHLTNRVKKLAYLRTVQDWIIRPQLRTVPNVADVDSIGGYVKQYHVLPKPAALQSYGLTLHDVIGALERNNQSLGAGYVERHGEAALVRTDSRLKDVVDIASVMVKEHKGTPITIGQIAEVTIGGELRQGSASVMGEEAVVGTAMMLSGANSRTVAVAVREKFDQEVRQSLPPGIKARAVLDRSNLVNATINTVAHNLFYGAILVVVVLFALLGNFRAAFLTALAIPLSMLLAALGMSHYGISGNLMSLGAIDFGIIIDGSVIIVENCLRRLGDRQRELGRLLTAEERLEVTQAASHEVRRATAFGETIIIIVYVPILALTGIEGKLFHPMALTVIFALTAAFVLSLTFVPAMVAMLVRGKVAEDENPLMCAAKRIYAPILDFALNQRTMVLIGALCLVATGGWQFTRLGQEFIPRLDEGDIAMHAMRIPSTGIEQSTRMQLRVEKAVAMVDEVRVVFSKTGTADIAADPMPQSVSDTFIIFKPRDEWRNPRLPKNELEKKVRKALADLVGNKYEFIQPIEMRFHELIAGVRGDVAIKVFGEAPETLRHTAEDIARVLGQVKGARDVKVEQTTGMPIITVRPKREVLARHGLDSDTIVDSVNIATGGRTAGQIFQGDHRFDIVVRLPNNLRERLDALEALPIPLPRHKGESPVSFTARTVDPHASSLPPTRPLGELAAISRAEGANQVSREQSKRRVVIQCNVRGRDLASFVNEARGAISHDVKLPDGVWLSWGGQYEHLLTARARLSMVVPLCFVMILLLLYTTFNATRPALLVFTGVPLALTGGVAALVLRDMDFTISAGVGFIALSGIAVLNGLVLVTFINQLREQGKRTEDAIREGALTRLRPVLMTALVASLGFVPMALATGTGAEVQRPLATVVIGGILTSTILTLVVLPALCGMAFKEEKKPT
ncbi:MAG: CusA/CzcA family heavy metal efflux RND transporter [Verrucomicrobiota bacterium]|jgi:cobalt-zinc-cadmium resistance protein CzcA|nr:CusA/CzcA family heavy metal efflux RND transporter [Verrucomicrobiota bacterium]